jgi:hypothetical protein
VCLYWRQEVSSRQRNSARWYLCDAAWSDDVKDLAQQGAVLEGLPKVLVCRGRNHHPRQVLDPVRSSPPPLLSLLCPGLCGTPRVWSPPEAPPAWLAAGGGGLLWGGFLFRGHTGVLILLLQGGGVLRAGQGGGVSEIGCFWAVGDPMRVEIWEGDGVNSFKGSA